MTSITSDQVSGNIFVVGFGDGAVRVYDRRQPQHDAMVMTWKKHKSWIQNVRMQRGGFRELVSASVDGVVKVWDVRYQESLRTIVSRDPISAMDLHGHAPVVAWYVYFDCSYYSFCFMIEYRFNDFLFIPLLSLVDRPHSTSRCGMSMARVYRQCVHHKDCLVNAKPRSPAWASIHTSMSLALEAMMDGCRFLVGRAL